MMKIFEVTNGGRKQATIERGATHDWRWPAAQEKGKGRLIRIKAILALFIQSIIHHQNLKRGWGIYTSLVA